MILPTDYPITQKFGRENTYPKLLPIYEGFGLLGHSGIDFKTPTGTLIVAPERFKIDYLQNDKTGYGRAVWGFTGVKDNRKIQFVFAHLDSYSGTKVGDIIEQGQSFARSGHTGFSTGPHLHWGTRYWIKTQPNKAYSDDWGIENYSNGYFGWTDPLLHVHKKSLEGYESNVVYKGDQDGARHYLVENGVLWWIPDEVVMACTGYLFSEAIEVPDYIIDENRRETLAIPDTHKSKEVKQLLSLLKDNQGRAKLLYNKYFK